MECGGEGITRMIIHKIPNFRELIIASFQCNDCDECNNEVTFGGEIQLQGCIFSLTVDKESDLDRQLVKSDSATIKLPDIEFEIPAKTQKGEISTIEGFLKTAAKNLSLFQPARKIQMPEVAAKVQTVIDSLEAMATGARLPFRLLLDDPSGNSYIENPAAPVKDPNMNTKYYFRTPDQDVSLGLKPNTGLFKDDKESNYKELMMGEFGAIRNPEKTTAVVEEGGSAVHLGRHETVSIPSHCANCNYLGESLTCVTDIPHFKEVIIMSFNCTSCGYKSNEVKGGGSVPTYGTDVILNVTCIDDLKRDVLKSDCCAVSIPHLDLELVAGSLGGMYTTVEGLIQKIHKQLNEHHAYQAGDSKSKTHSDDAEIQESKSKFQHFLDDLLACSRGENLPFSIKLHDPLGNSFISAPLGSFLPINEDENLTVSDFTRTFDEEEDLGLNDINTKDFETYDDPSQARDDGIHLSDRATTTVKKGLDHPSFFAKGCEENDNTGTGAYIEGTKKPEQTDEDESHSNTTWKAAKINAMGLFELEPASQEDENDVSDQDKEPVSESVPADLSDEKRVFVASDSFDGKREGFVFRRGDWGCE